MAKEVNQWLESHAREYEATNLRLSLTRANFMHAPTSKAMDMLEKSIVNAIISQQTPVDRHEAGYVHYVNTGEIPSYVNFYNQKARWLDTHSKLHVANVVRMVKARNIRGAISYLTEHFTGLSYIKASFTLAMLGFTECMCLDTNVQQLVNVSYKSKDFKNVDMYNDVCQEICMKYTDLELTPFMLQWVLFDFKRGNHSTHEVWFKSLNTWIEI